MITDAFSSQHPVSVMRTLPNTGMTTVIFLTYQVESQTSHITKTTYASSQQLLNATGLSELVNQTHWYVTSAKLSGTELHVKLESPLSSYQKLLSSISWYNQAVGDEKLYLCNVNVGGL